MKPEFEQKWLARIRAWLELGDERDAEWYRRANLWCKRIGRKNGLDYRRVAAILAALSPGTHWDRNLAETEALISGEDIEFTTYPNNVDKAYKILRAPKARCYLDLVKPLPRSGWKIGSFYLNIIGPGKDLAVTIDRHAIAICIGRKPEDRDMRLTPARYASLAEAYRAVAREKGMLAHEVQAITWAEYRRRNGDLHQTDLPF